MNFRRLFLIAILPLTAFAQPFAPDADSAAQKPAQETPAHPALSPDELLTQYRHDQINLLALHADAPSLLAAALLAQPDASNKDRPDALKAPALIARAQQYGADSPLVWWVTASIECQNKPNDCPRTETLQKLERRDAQNAAVWAWALGRAQQAGDDIIARATLTSAAQAKYFEDYFGTLIATIYRGESILPMRSQLLNATGQDASVDGYRLITAAGIAAGLAHAPAAAIEKACENAADVDPTRLEDCLLVARKMAQAGSMSARQKGLILLESLQQNGQAHVDAVAKLRGHQWKMAQIGRLGRRLADDTRVTRTYLGALHDSGRENDAIIAVLRSQGVALQPPIGWVPENSNKPTTPQ